MDIIGLSFLLMPGSILLAFVVAAIAAYQRFAADKLKAEGYALASGGDFLRYALLFFGEVASVIFIIQIIFTGINLKFPDTSFYPLYLPYSNGAISTAISALVVIFPLMIAIEWWIRRSKTRGVHETLAHKGYIWAGLVVTTLIIVVTAITTLNKYLTGELSIRFVLKAVSLGLIAALLCGFRVAGILKPKMKHVFTVAYVVAGVVIAATVVWGFILIGSPATARSHRLDEQRVSNLWSIQQRVFEYWNTHNELPAPLGSLEVHGKLPVDPVTNAPYKYEIAEVKQPAPGGIVHYRLCATFDLPSEEFGPAGSVLNPGPNPGSDDVWKHGKGDTCFERSIDPKDFPKANMYPVPVNTTPSDLKTGN